MTTSRRSILAAGVTSGLALTAGCLDFVFGAERVDVDVTITSFTHEDDLIVLLGSHPSLLAEEAANLELLRESVEHPV